MCRVAKLISLCLVLIYSDYAFSQKPQSTDSRTLGMAIEYFQSGKYHEALLLFERLDKEYELNMRFLAYMGVCYYYGYQYKQACKYLDQLIPKLHVFSPGEQTVYYKACAESHFILEEYDEAIQMFKKTLEVCSDEEKGDFLYKIGFSYMFHEKYDSAYHYFSSSLDNYNSFNGRYTTEARVVQIRKMIKGCQEKLHGNKPSRSQDTIFINSPCLHNIALRIESLKEVLTR